MKKSDFNKPIQDIMKMFKWGQVHKAMTALDWHWTKGRVPTIEEMKKFVKKELFDSVLDHLLEIKDTPTIEHDYFIESGGFRVTITEKKVFELAFIVESWEEEKK